MERKREKELLPFIEYRINNFSKKFDNTLSFQDKLKILGVAKEAGCFNEILHHVNNNFNFRVTDDKTETINQFINLIGNQFVYPLIDENFKEFFRTPHISVDNWGVIHVDIRNIEVKHLEGFYYYMFPFIGDRKTQNIFHLFEDLNIHVVLTNLQWNNIKRKLRNEGRI